MHWREFLLMVNPQKMSATFPGQPYSEVFQYSFEPPLGSLSCGQNPRDRLVYTHK